jgi:hypothetical protein
LKQALIVDPHGAVQDFARIALSLYQQTTVSTLQEAAALASGAEYGLILIAQHESMCDGGLWMMVERIANLAEHAALIMVMSQTADAAFHARAAEVGATVLTAPLDVTSLAEVGELTAG